MVVDAAGPETFTFEELLWLLASAVGALVRLVHTPASLGLALTQMGRPAAAGRGALRRRGTGLMAGWLTSNFAPTSTTRLGGWLACNRSVFGRRYVSELTRNCGHQGSW